MPERTSIAPACSMPCKVASHAHSDDDDNNDGNDDDYADADDDDDDDDDGDDGDDGDEDYWRIHCVRPPTG